MEMIYIASPCQSILKLEPQCPPDIVLKRAVNIALCASKYAREELNLIPVSPILAFHGIYNELNPSCTNPALERELVTKAGLSLLKSCTKFGWTETPFSPFSSGMEAEKKLADKLGMLTYIIDLGVSI